MINWHARRVATIQIYYYMPDHNSIIQEFLWQTEDLVPEFPRIHKFLWHWKREIDARIQEIQLSYMDPYQKTRYINFNQMFDI